MFLSASLLVEVHLQTHHQHASRRVKGVAHGGGADAVVGLVEYVVNADAGHEVEHTVHRKRVGGVEVHHAVAWRVFVRGVVGLRLEPSVQVGVECVVAP